MDVEPVFPAAVLETVTAMVYTAGSSVPSAPPIVKIASFADWKLEHDAP
jgi:hypothetical protein